MECKLHQPLPDGSSARSGKHRRVNHPPTIDITEVYQWNLIKESISALWTINFSRTAIIAS